MEKVLKPERLDVDPGSTQATVEFNHWFKTFTHYLLVSSNVYQHIANIDNYDRAIQILKDLYIKPRNVIAARHELRTVCVGSCLVRPLISLCND